MLPLALAVIVGSSAPCRPPLRHLEDPAWLRANCSVLTRAAKSVEQAEAFLARLVTLKDLPRFSLLVVDGLRGPQAYVTRTREIVLSKAALDLCHEKSTRDEAEANVAFLLAHELGHWAHDDHVLGLLGQDDVDVFEFALGGQEERELKADATAVVDVARAGLDPKAVLGGRLLRRWARDARFKADTWYKTRKRSLGKQATAVKENLALFEAGAAFSMAGLYEDAATMLDTFARATYYDGREVLSDIGFAKLQLAFRALAACDASDALRFALPDAIDTGTRADRFRGAGSSSPCRDDDPFRTLIDEARADLDKTVRTDADYPPARLNLIAALLLDRRFTEALSQAESDRSRLELTDAEGLALDMGLAVAKYGTGEQMNNAEFRRQALADLRRLAERAPHDVAVAYNLARMRSELADPAVPASRAEATRAWAHVLRLDPPRPLAAEAKRMLKPPDAPEDDDAAESVDEDDDGATGAPRHATAACLATVGAPLPFPLGRVDRKKNPTLPKPIGPPLDFGPGKLYVYRDKTSGTPGAPVSPRWTAYAIETEFNPAAVVVVSEDLAPPLALDALREQLGPPVADTALADGRRVQRYKGCAWVIDGEQAVQRLVFQVE